MTEPDRRALTLIARERLRQIRAEGFTLEHDDRLFDGELASAAVCYASPESAREKTLFDIWPFEIEAWKPSLYVDRVRELVKAGALIAAEIERLQRAADTAHEFPLEGS